MVEKGKKKRGKTLALNQDQQDQLYELLQRDIKQSTIAEQSKQLFGVELSTRTISDYKKRFENNIFDQRFGSQNITASIVYRNMRLIQKSFNEAMSTKNGINIEAANLMHKLQDQLIKLGGLNADIKVVHTVEFTQQQRQDAIDYIINTPILEIEADEN